MYRRNIPKWKSKYLIVFLYEIHLFIYLSIFCLCVCMLIYGRYLLIYVFTYAHVWDILIYVFACVYAQV